MCSRNSTFFGVISWVFAAVVAALPLIVLLLALRVRKKRHQVTA